MPQYDLQQTYRAYSALTIALNEFKELQPEQATIDTAVNRGYFLPEEDEYLWSMVSRYLTIRGGFWEIIEQMSQYFSDQIDNVQSQDDWRFFLFGYASSCQVVGMARLLVDELAKHKLVQRKINEGSPTHRIQRKAFTDIYQSLSDADNAIKMQYMMNFVEDNRKRIDNLVNDEIVGDIVWQLDRLETTLHPSQWQFIKLRLGYLWHAIRRRFAVSKQFTSFFILEKAGKAIAEIGDHQNKRVTPEVRAVLAEILEPGDVIITRHDFVASNLFLPGYWPHAALYVGTEEERDTLNVSLDKATAKRWSGEISILEAKKDGVLFRPLAETLAVDELVIVRPQLESKQMASALERISQHEGKGYNFDFDFFRSDQLVCTEVVYRAFDGMGEINFELIERAGRYCLSAEDILDKAVNNNGFSAIAAFGIAGCETQVALGAEALPLITASYASKPIE